MGGQHLSEGSHLDICLRVQRLPGSGEREFFIDNLLVRIHFIIVMIRRTGLAPWEFEFPGSLTSTFLGSGPPIRVSGFGYDLALSE